MKSALATVLRWPLPARWLGLGVLLAVNCIGWCIQRSRRPLRYAWLAWLALPEVARLAVILIGFVALAVASG
jgi:hypothetical protein